MAAKAAASNGKISNGKVTNGFVDHHSTTTNGQICNGTRRREAADYYVKGESIAATELHLRKPAFAAAAVASD